MMGQFVVAACVRGVVISIKVGPYLFRKHGEKVVLSSQFIPLLRIRQPSGRRETDALARRSCGKRQVRCCRRRLLARALIILENFLQAHAVLGWVALIAAPLVFFGAGHLVNRH
jgi:hypothetical protein